MARRLLFHTILNSNANELKLPSSLRLHKQLHTQIPTKEIQIPVKYGHIAGKLWGSGEGRPILALHGWQDNAGTWDPLIPMIVKDRPILAIDFPGHGLSSWIPPGMMYYDWEWPRLILYLKEYLKWDKVSILGHSMGAIAGMRFSSVFPDDVDFFIAIDNFLRDNQEDVYTVFLEKTFPKYLKKGLMAQAWLDKEPPTYTLEEITKLWHLGTNKSVAVESVPHLLKRGAKQTKTDPTKYHISRDSRIKYSFVTPEDKKFVEFYVKRLKCPMLLVRAINTPFSTDKFSVEMRELLEKVNDKYELHFLPGTHHVHLNNPELVAPLINQFMQKHNLNLLNIPT